MRYIRPQLLIFIHPFIILLPFLNSFLPSSFDTFHRHPRIHRAHARIALFFYHLPCRGHARLSSVFSHRAATHFPCTIFLPFFPALTIFSPPLLRSIIYKRIHRCLHCSFPVCCFRSAPEHERCSFISIVPEWKVRGELLIIRPRFLLGVASAILFTASLLFCLSLSLCLSLFSVSSLACQFRAWSRERFTKVHCVIGMVN